MIKLSTIKSNPNNPRVIKDDKFLKLVQSIKEFPKMMELRPMVVNSEMVVLGGNMRLKALKEAGYKEIPDEWVKNADELTEEEQRRFIISDNVGSGEHDFEMLKSEWDVEELAAWGLDIPDFEVEEEIPEAEEEGNFGDPGISDKNQYGVIVICESAGTQESVFNDLTNMGFNCKIVVT